jgi:hypothetical protein
MAMQTVKIPYTVYVAEREKLVNERTGRIWLWKFESWID